MLPQDNEQLEAFKVRVLELARRIGAPEDFLPTFGFTRDGACPHVEARNGQFHFVIVERGQELERISSADPNEILYHVFESVTFTMAIDYEIAHRKKGQDVRRIMFASHQELMGQLNLDWRARLAAAQAKTLQKNPFIDRR